MSGYNKLWYIYIMEYYAAGKKKGIPTFCDIMNGAGYYHAK